MVTAVSRRTAQQAIATRPQHEEATVSNSLPQAAGFGLRLFEPELVPATPPGGPGALSPEMSLTDLHESWVVPVVYPQRKTAPATVEKNRDALCWWRQITGDPPLARTDDFTLARFREGLAQATYRKGKLGALRPLSPHTQARHLLSVNRLLLWAGPRIDRRRPGANLLEHPPQMLVDEPEADCKPPFSVDVCRAILEAAQHLPGTRAMPPTIHRAFWTAFGLVQYYTGLREGTSLGGLWEHVVTLPEGSWLRLPAAVVTKKRKRLEKYIHPAALAALERLRLLMGGVSPKLLPYAHCTRWLVEQHERLQRLAGVPEAEVLSPHAWRRTHATEMGLLGIDSAYKVAQHALDHASDRTTREWYAKLEPHFIRQLPAIEPDAPNGQKWLF